MAAGLRAVLGVSDIIDAVLEVRDARLPRSTAATDLHNRLKSKPRIVLLNRSDLADPSATRTWLETLARRGTKAFAIVASSASSLRGVRAALQTMPRKRAALHVAVVGAPNTGKSSLINALGRSKRAPAQDKAGVTRHLRWLKIGSGIALLDTPGVLPPRIVDPDSAWQLALCGSLPESAYDIEDAVAHFHRWLIHRRPQLACKADLDAFAEARGMRRRGGELDRLNAARKLVSLFRDGRLARITFETPERA